MDGEYIDRKYRKSFAAGRWHGFSVCYKETDLWIGIDRASWNEDIPSFASSYVQSLRHEMDSWIASHAEYAASLVPVECTDDAPLIFRQMAEVAFHSGIGPMSAVAGAVAAFTGRAIKEWFGVVEVLVENGGDIYADIATDMDVSVFAGRSPLSERVGLHIKADGQPFGICTSSGTVGPSLSFGKADAVMIVCRDAMLADTYATAYANMVKTEEDVDICIEDINGNSEIMAAMAIKGGKMGVCGCMDFVVM